MVTSKILISTALLILVIFVSIVQQLANMQDHISYTKEHMESLKQLCEEQKPPPEIFVVVSNSF